MIRTLENVGVGHFKTPKKKPKFGGNTHITLNLKPKVGVQLGMWRFIPSHSLTLLGA
jgi:hypothetical protein